MATDTNRIPISLRLSRKGLRLLDTLAKEQGITRTATIELMIRKAAEEAEDRMTSVYDILHDLSD